MSSEARRSGAGNTIEVSAIAMRDPAGRVLNVRKQGTSALMLPGGKPEPGEDPRDTAIREFREELGVELDPLRLHGLGTFRAAAANEAGFEVIAHVFEHPYVEVDRPLAEIEHLEWVDPALYSAGSGLDTGASRRPEMAPLNTEWVFPALARAARPPQRVAVYIGSSLGTDPIYEATARAFGAGLAETGIGLVYGGGRVGLMGVVADAALEAGGEVIGVITEALVSGETAHTGLTRLEVVQTMQQRKRRMAELTDAFVAMPGGLGTLEELFEAWTWVTLGIHTKPVAVYDVADYWQPLLTMIDAMVDAGFSAPAARDALVVASDPVELLSHLGAWVPPRPKWAKDPL